MVAEWMRTPKIRLQLKYPSLNFRQVDQSLIIAISPPCHLVAEETRTHPIAFMSRKPTVATTSEEDSMSDLTLTPIEGSLKWQ